MQVAWLTAAALVMTAEPGRPAPVMWEAEVYVTLMGDTGDTANVVARTRVPSACFEATGTEARPPAGVRIREHLVALQLLVQNNRAKHCDESPTFVEHRRRDLDLRGKVGMVVFVVADGTVKASWNRVWRKK
jgi:hypothetical protein